MLLKASLHFHTADDPHDYVPYSTKEGIDYAHTHGFSVLALTCHNHVAWTPAYAAYAEERDITLISGIECDIGEMPGEKRHLVILNCEKDAEQIHTFRDLAEYKKVHPDIFVIAPHPFYPHIGKTISLLEYTEKYTHLFDAIEHSWFYSRISNKNLPAEEVAGRHNLPLVATSDAHVLDFFDTDYCVIDAPDRTPAAMFSALRAGSFKNVTRPKKVFREFMLPVFLLMVRNRLYAPRKI